MHELKRKQVIEKHKNMERTKERSLREKQQQIDQQYKQYIQMKEEERKKNQEALFQMDIKMEDDKRNKRGEQAKKHKVKLRVNIHRWNLKKQSQSYNQLSRKLRKKKRIKINFSK